MRYFITENKSYKDFKDFYVCSTEEIKPQLIEFVTDVRELGFDTETNGLDAWINDSLLYVLGDKEIQFVIDVVSVDSSFIKEIFTILYNQKTTLIGVNIKFDIKRLFRDTGLLYKYVYDIMIAEQRLWQKLGISASLEAISNRYLNLEENANDKRIRREFIGVDKNYFKFEYRHIDYAAKDVSPLFDIKDIQVKDIDKKQLGNLLYHVEFPLIHIVAKAELKGSRFDKEKWINVYNKNLDRQFELEQELDIEFRKLRDESDLPKEYRLRCTGGKYDKIRVKSSLLNIFNSDGTPKGVDLFGEPLTSKQVTGVKKKIDLYSNNINYKSDSQIVEIFAHLRELLPTKAEVYQIPKFKGNKIDKTFNSYLTNTKVLDQRLIDYPNNKMNHFIELLLEHRKMSTLINTFGLKFVGNINPITNCIHSEYRQAHAATGRFQSGGGRGSNKPNMQNIPGIEDLRSCFIARPGYSIITADYSGAELIVMCSLSQDMDLLEMSKRDMHSEIATKCWRAVYKYRAEQFNKQIIAKHSTLSHFELDQAYAENLELSKTFFVDKSKSKVHLRTAFKPITFGVIYGLHAKGLAKYLGISVEEAKEVIKTIKNTFPKVFKMVESYSKFAERNGFVILNNRTLSRAYFPNIIKELRGEYSREFYWQEISKDINEARNVPIQGTQADFIKESTVRLQKYIDKNSIDATILNWIHDEIVVECEKLYDGRSSKWKHFIRDFPEGLSYTELSGKKHTGLNFPQVQRLIMNDTANQYLHNVTIDTDYTVCGSWTKEEQKYHDIKDGII